MRRTVAISILFMCTLLFLGACFSNDTSLLAVDDADLTRVLALTPIAFATPLPEVTSAPLPTNLARPTAAPPQSVTLAWRVRPDDVLSYRAALDQPTGYTQQLSVDWGALLSGTFDAQATLAQLDTFALPTDGALTGQFRPGTTGNTITLNLIADDPGTALQAEATAEPDTPAATVLLPTLLGPLDGSTTGATLLSGQVQADGAIASFYQPQTTRNVLAMLAQLPTEPVQVGSRWQVDWRCLQAAPEAQIDFAERVHQVSLREIRTDDSGERIAVIDYLLIEALAGVDGSGAFLSERCSYIARGEFRVTNGRWASLRGEYSRTSLGLSASNVIYRVGLAPQTTILQPAATPAP